MRNLFFGIAATSLLLLSQFAHAQNENPVFGPEVFKSENFTLTRNTRTINLEELPTGKYKMVVQNGNLGPFLYKQCEGLPTVEEKRQCQYDNLLEKTDRNYNRVDKAIAYVNGRRVFLGKTISKSYAYFEETILLDRAENTLIVDVQGYPTAGISVAIYPLETLNNPPTALYSINRYSGAAPLSVTFNATHSFDVDGQVLTYNWDFGDGVTVNAGAMTQTHIYQNPGSFTTTLTVLDPNGNSSTFSSTTVVKAPNQTTPATNVKPIGVLNVSYSNPSDLRTINVSTSGSYDPDGVIELVEINFGDGTKVQALESDHTYANDGTYLVVVKFKDDFGATITKEKTVQVAQANAFEALSTFWGPTDLYGSFSSSTSFIQNLTLTQEQANEFYRITLVNADGENHPVTTCGGSVIDKLACQFQNLFHNTYISLNRVTSAHLYINGKRYTASGSISKANYLFQTYAKLTSSAKIEVRYSGYPTAYVTLKIEKLGITTDSTAPVLSSNLTSNTSTKNSLVEINVQDNQDTVTEVFVNAVKLLESNYKKITFNLKPGISQVEVRSKDMAGNIAENLILENINFDQVLPVITVTAPTKYYVTSLPASLDFSATLNEPGSVSIGETVYGTNTTEFTGTFTATTAGAQALTVVAKDLAGNENSKAFAPQVILDNLPPVITIGGVARPLTNQGTLAIPIKITEANSAWTTIRVNGNELLQTGSKSFTASLILDNEGENYLEVTSTDAAGNTSQLASKTIVKDSIPAIISELLPSDSEVFDHIIFPVSGKSNERLKSAKVNNLNLKLSTDKMTFTGNYTASEMGSQTLHWVLTDEAGNISEINTSISVNQSLLVARLIKISLDPQDNTKVNIKGAPSATRPGVSITIREGVLSLNRRTLTASNVGSFSAKLKKANEFEVLAYDQNTGEEAKVYIKFSKSTRLSGIVKDTNDAPLYNATVSIDGNSQSVKTDATGAFAIDSATSGDHVLTIDGATIPAPLSGPTRKFSVTRISVNLGNGATNILPRTIYLAALLTDGSETPIAANQSAVVENPAAPGVTLEVPAGKAVFPDGSNVGAINIATIDSEKATIPTPDIAVPTKVLALEPSGLSFTERVDLELPNDNELPAGLDMVIFSMNSKKGIWEIDGLAQVSEDGRSVKTKPGQGISHFSLVYAVPVMPQITAMHDKAVTGIDVSKGSLTSRVELPSFKVLGESVTPSLTYKSNWAHPTAFVSNMIDIPEQKTTFSYSDSFETADRIVKVETCFIGICDYEKFRVWAEVNQEVTGTSSWVPDAIRSQFFISSLASNQVVYQDVQTDAAFLPGSKFLNSVNSQIVSMQGIPNRSVVSYAVPLKDSNSGEYLTTGIYPSLARYEFRLKNMILRTVTTKVTTRSNSGDIDGNVQISQDTNLETRLLENLTPQDVRVPLIVQNKVASPFGRGWSGNFVQKIINPENQQLYIEEANGEVVSYSPKNIISTLSQGTIANVNYENAVDLSQFPIIAAIREYSKQNAMNSLKAEYASIYSGNSPSSTLSSPRNPATASLMKVNLQNGTVSLIKDLDTEIGYGTQFYGSSDGDRYYFYRNPRFDGLTFAAGKHYLVSSTQNRLSTVTTAGSETVLEGFEVPTEITNTYLGPFTVPSISNRSQWTSLMESYANTNNMYSFMSEPWLGPISNPSKAARFWSVGGYKYGFNPLLLNATDETVLPNLQINYISGISVSNTGKIALAHSGTNIVVVYNQNLQTKSIIAGDGNNQETIPGGSAIGTSIFHPKGVLWDSQENLYITAENGYVYKVDSAGILHHIAGLPVEKGGVLSSQGHGDTFALNNPTHMAIDESQNFLYVSDSSNHRVIKIDLTSKMVTTVAGNGSCDSVDAGDGRAALNASLCNPGALKLDANKNLVIADTGHNSIRIVSFGSSSLGAIGLLPDSKDGSSLTKNPDGTFERKYRNGSKAIFNAQGRQISSVTTTNQVTNYFYDGNGNLTQISAPGSQTTSLTYNGNKISSITDPAGRTTNLNYSGNQLTSIGFPDGTGKSFEYNENGLLTKETNQRNISTKYTYNQWNRLENIESPNGDTSSISDTITASISNPYTGGTVGQMRSPGFGETSVNDLLVDAKENVTEIAKDFRGYISKIKDARGLETKLHRDIEGNVIKVIYPDSSEKAFSYNEETKDLLTISDLSLGFTETYTYDSKGNVIRVVDGNNKEITRTYDPTTSNLTSEITPNGHTTIYTYNALGLIESKVLNPSAGTITVAYQYDNKGNLKKIIEPDGRETSFNYDLAGNAIQRIDKINTNLSATTNYTYDAFNRIISVISPKGETTEYSYLPTGQLSQITAPNNKVTTFEYDSKGRLNKKTDPSGMFYTYIYDKNDNLIQETDPNGNIKNYSYNEVNKIIQKVTPTDSYNFSYDVRGNLAQASNQNSVLINTHDSRGLTLTSSLAGAGTISDYPIVPLTYTYDGIGARTSMSSPVLSINYGYNLNGKMNSMSSSDGSTYQFTFDSINRLRQINRPGSITTLEFLGSGSVYKILHTSGGVEFSKNEYSYDLRGLPTSNATKAGVYNYVYDLNSQVTSASAPLSGTESFSYDLVGNIISTSLGANSISTDGQKLQEDWQYVYGYDNNGNLIFKNAKVPTAKTYTYSYSADNQLTEIKELASPFGATIKHIVLKYDVLGRRIEKIVTDNSQLPTQISSRRYIYDDANVIAEYDGSNQLLATNTYSSLGNDNILSTRVTTDGVNAGIASQVGIYHYIKDALGTITEITNSSGQVIQKYEYSLFGKILAIKDGSGNNISLAPNLNPRFTFTAREFDSDSGLYFYRARYMDAETGRFLQRDPEPGRLSDPSTIVNPYSYAGNGPTFRSDPSGRFWWLVAFAVVGAVQGYMAGQEAGLSGWNLVGSTLLGGLTSVAAPGIGNAYGVVAGLAASAISNAVFQGGIQILAYGKVVNQSNVWAAGGAGLVGGALGYSGSKLAYDAGLSLAASTWVDNMIGLGVGSMGGGVMIPTPTRDEVNRYKGSMRAYEHNYQY